MIEPTSDSIIDLLNKPSPSARKRLINKKKHIPRPPRPESNNSKSKAENVHHWVYTKPPPKATSEVKEGRNDPTVLSYTFTMNNSTLHGKIDTRPPLQPELLRDDW